MWNLAAPPNFQGLQPNLPVNTYTRHLPHWRQDGATYFVTFRLGDSLPQAKLRELTAMRADWEEKHPPPRPISLCEEFAKATFRKVEFWLDQGMGSCVLRDAPNRQIVSDSLMHFDGQRYELGCFVVMPNHVHAVVRPLETTKYSLEIILQSWKRRTATAINRLQSTTGSLWQDESFDRIIRDDEHLWRCIQYIGANGKSARLATTDFTRWIQPSWEALGWRFDDAEK